jgi:flagellar biosynthesis anti-sigma factor FlgM
MKIDNPSQVTAQVTTNAASQTVGVQPGQGGGGRGKLDGNPDRVQLSNLSAALRDLNAEDPARTAEVQRIGAAVQSGSYSIDPLAVGQKIIAEGLEYSA